MSRNLVKSTFYNGYPSDLTTRELINITGIEANREILCMQAKLDNYIDNTIFVTLQPIGIYKRETVSPNYLKDLTYVKPYITPIENQTIESILGGTCPYNDDFKLDCKVGVNRLSKEDVEGISVIGNYIVEAAYGKIFLGLLGDRKVLIKYTSFRNSDKGIYDTFNREICNQHLASMAGISPKIHSYWLCKQGYEDITNGVILMDVIESMTLKDYFRVVEGKIVEAILEAFHLILRLNIELNIFHGDAHSGNILVTNDKIFIIDFGHSGTINRDQQLNRDYDFFFLYISEDSFISSRWDILEIVIFNSLHNNSLYERLSKSPLTTVDEVYSYISSMFTRLTKPHQVRGLPIYGLIPEKDERLKHFNTDDLIVDRNPDADSNLLVYHGKYRDEVIIVSVYVNSPSNMKKTIEMHLDAYNKGIATELLAYGRSGSNFFTITKDSTQDYNIIKTNIKRGFDFYLSMLRIFLILNIEMNIIHGEAKIRCLVISDSEILLRRCSHYNLTIDTKYNNLSSITHEYIELLKITNNTIYYLNSMNKLSSLSNTESNWAWEDMFEKLERRLDREPTVSDIITYMEKYRV